MFLIKVVKQVSKKQSGFVALKVDRLVAHLEKYGPSIYEYNPNGWNYDIQTDTPPQDKYPGTDIARKAKDHTFIVSDSALMMNETEFDSFVPTSKVCKQGWEGPARTASLEMHTACANILHPTIWPAAGLYEMDMILESIFNPHRYTEADLIEKFGPHALHEVEWTNGNHKRAADAIEQALRDMPRSTLKRFEMERVMGSPIIVMWTGSQKKGQHASTGVLHAQSTIELESR